AAITASKVKPIAFWVLTFQNMEQAQARAGGTKGNKGVEALRAAVLAAQAVGQIHRMPLGRPA
ncbi:MAG: 6,7-dimethyl-8-ribityllumazine synthase, partial [Limnohabitans sp.]|nr:6,7-dimethyl-8-ribityllumazine synthase [Limnohabitans sp.]